MNFPFVNGVVPRSISYGIYISQLILFARVSSHVDDFNTRNKVLTAIFLKQGYRYNNNRNKDTDIINKDTDIINFCFGSLVI